MCLILHLIRNRNVRKPKRKMSYYSKHSIIKEIMESKNKEISDVTVDDVFDHLLGEYDGRNCTDYTLQKYKKN